MEVKKFANWVDWTRQLHQHLATYFFHSATEHEHEHVRARALLGSDDAVLRV